MAEDMASFGLGSLAMAPLVGFRASSGMARLTGDTTSPEFVGPLPRAASATDKAGGYGVAFFGENNIRFYNVENATLGAKGKSFFLMPLEDSAVVTSAGSAARYTGMSPSTLKAYAGEKGGDIFGISFPTKGMEVRLPTAADALGSPHFLEGGHTAVRLEGPNAGYLVNPTREFVVPGGNAVPSGAVMFRIGPNGDWIPVRRF